MGTLTTTVCKECVKAQTTPCQANTHGNGPQLQKHKHQKNTATLTELTSVITTLVSTVLSDKEKI